MMHIRVGTLCLFLTAVSAASGYSQTPTPTIATDILKADIDAVLKHTGTEGAGVDRQIKVVDIGKYNVAVGVLHRGPVKEGTPVSGISHAHVTEVYYVISGAGTLVTGGTVANARPLPVDGEIVKVAVGPSTNGLMEGGQRRPVAAGDVIIIPPGVAHGFSEVKDHITYLSVRPDPDHILPAGYVHPALKK
jgi:mannose-6-phosphate isomerase-like protein (cupin superfamily)